MMSAIKLPIESLTSEPYSSILCYPHTNPAEVENRIIELRELGVEAIELTGSNSAISVPHMPVIGKGHQGIVVIAYVGNERLAVKIRRTDSTRGDCCHEAAMLQQANQIGIGPKFIAATKNCLLSHFIDGDFLLKWLLNHNDKVSCRKVITDIFEQCWALDEAGLNHGELSNAHRHLLLEKNGRVFIVDFESATIRFKVSNVTSICQYLFIGNNPVRMLIWEILGEKDPAHIIGVLHSYKRERTIHRFENLLRVVL